MDLLTVLEVLKSANEMVQSSVPNVVAALMATLFLRKNTQTTEIEKIKNAKFSEVANDLLAKGEITHYEYYKCKNFLNIAKKADQINARNRDHRNYSSGNEFDFDWFIRFFEASSKISNEDMQMFWARILAGEVNTSGSFSLRTIETLSQMTRKEALVFQKISQLTIRTISGMWFIIAEGVSAFEMDEIEDLIISNETIRLLQECGILNPIKDDLIVWFSTMKLFNPISINGNFALMNNKTIMLFHANEEESSKIQSSIDKGKAIYFPYYPLTEAGRQLLPIIRQESEYEHFLELGHTIDKHVKLNSERNVTAHTIIEIQDSKIYYDEDNDLLDKE